MTLRLTNTLTRRTEPFEPLVPGKVSIYCCGVTVYDLCHLGHARSYIVWDVLRRYLIWRGYAVTFVQNFTDIDDKILARAAEQGSSMEAVSERNIEEYWRDMDRLHILRPDRTPRATRSLAAIRNLIRELEAKGAAYSADGDVYFAVTRAPHYGRLSGRHLEEQREGGSGRVSADEEARKHHPFDFALWKAAKPGEPAFPSPWGPGRPGWHIECSAMVREELGDTIDLHLGGADLIFPHHENEIAQSEAATGRPLARWWLHNGMVNVGGEKMSKSLGNFTTIRALLDSGVSPMTLRLFVLQAHYRKPLDFTAAALEAAAAGWRGLDAALAVGGGMPAWGPANPADLAGAEAARAASGDSPLPAELASARERFVAAMDDDLNTAAALGEIFELARPLRSLASRLRVGDAPNASDRALAARWRLLVELAGVLGLQQESAFAPGASSTAGGTTPAGGALLETSPQAVGPADEEIERLVEERRQAKARRDYAAADRIRDELGQQGIDLVDKAGGITVWLRRS